MSRNRHNCTLPFKNTSGLPRLAPNAHWLKRLRRTLRTIVLMNPNHPECKKMFRNNSAILRERRRHATGPHFFVIHPLSILNVILQMAFIILCLYLLLMEPLLLFAPGELFDSTMDIHRKKLTPVHLLLILQFFNTGYIDEETKRVVLEPKKIIRRYLFSYFIFDFLGTYLAVDIPTIWLAPDNRDKCVSYGLLIRTIAWAVRISTLLKLLDDCLIHFKFGKTARPIIAYVVKTYFIMHLFSFMLLLVPTLCYYYGLKFTIKSYLFRTGLIFINDPGARYLLTIRLVFGYFFGMPSVEMLVLNEQICAVIISFFGRLYTLYLLADILRILGVVGVSESLYQRQISVIHNYAADQGLPDKLRQRMLTYCHFKFQGRYFDEDAIKNSLSDKLRAELFFFTARKIVEKAEVFKNLPQSTVGSLVAAMKLEIFSPNDIIIKTGAETSEIYFISTGSVAVSSSSGAELCHLKDGDEFGASCLLFKKQIYAVVAIETTEVFIIDKNQLMEFLYPFPEAMNGFYILAKKRLAKLKNLEERSAEQPDLLSELRSGNILEKRAKRLIASD